MANISKTTYLKDFSLMKRIVSCLKVYSHGNNVGIVFFFWFRQWLGAGRQVDQHVRRQWSTMSNKLMVSVPERLAC